MMVLVDGLAMAFVISAAAVFIYHHIGYPLVIARLADKRRAARAARGGGDVPIGDDELPSLTLLVPAYNEAAVIADKIANLVALDYPRDRLEIVIALDGCTDDTQTIAETALIEHGSPSHIVIRPHARNVGKIATLNREIARITSDVVGLSDASALFAPDSLRRGAQHFLDPKVGIVCATYELLKAGSAGEAAYTDYQTKLKADEAELASPIGAHGAFYFFRRAPWQPMPATTINDDFILPMSIVGKGFSGIYDRSIIARELEKTEPDQEFRRRIRIGAGNTQQALWFAHFANPRNGWLAFLFISGKGMRPWIPFMVILALAVALYLALAGYWLFQAGLVLAVLVFAVAGYAIANRQKNLPKLVQWIGYLVEGHWASMRGAIRYLRAPTRAIWPVQAPVQVGGAEASPVAGKDGSAA